MSRIRTAVIGVGAFGRNHVRVLSQLADAELIAIVDTDLQKAQQLAATHGASAFATIEELLDRIDAAVVATPTMTHEAIATRLLESGIDVLVEKPIADSSAAGERLATLAKDRGLILQVGHLERFNPAVMALEKALTVPLFFEIHRLSVFTPRSLDIDVVLDLMIHDLDIVLSFTRELPQETRAAGISVLSPRIDIANVRLSFASGCVANLTASRISTEKIRKLRLFQPGEYLSVDYERQDASRLAIRRGLGRQSSPLIRPSMTEIAFESQIGFESLPVDKQEPLHLELASFLTAVRERAAPRVDGFQAANALRVAENILVKIEEHAHLVSETIRRRT